MRHRCTDTHTHRFKQFWFCLYWCKQMQSYKSNTWYNLICLLQQSYCNLSTKEKLSVSPPPPPPPPPQKKKQLHWKCKIPAWCPQHGMEKQYKVMQPLPTHLVKACNPYCSQCVLCDFAWHFFSIYLTTVQSWEMQFRTDKLTVFP